MENLQAAGKYRFYFIIYIYIVVFFPKRYDIQRYPTLHPGILRPSRQRMTCCVVKAGQSARSSEEIMGSSIWENDQKLVNMFQHVSTVQTMFHRFLPFSNLFPPCFTIFSPRIVRRPVLGSTRRRPTGAAAAALWGMAPCLGDDKMGRIIICIYLCHCLVHFLFCLFIYWFIRLSIYCCSLMLYCLF